MKKIVSRYVLTVMLVVMAISMNAQSFKLSGGLRELLTESAASIRRAADNQSRISLLMKVTDASLMAQVCDDYHMLMVTDLGHIAVVAVPVDQIEHAAADPRVVRMEKEGGFHLCLDEARKTANVNPTTAGQAPLTQAYKGKGILVGVLDSGFQYDHPTFRDANGQLRIRKAWDLQEVGGDYQYVELSTPEAILNKKCSFASTQSDNPTNHGTHVAGIAAGAGSANASKYCGMAPESDILLNEYKEKQFKEGGDQKYSDAIISGVSNMMNYAKTAQQPIVINVSLGNNLGFSTDCKVFEEAFAQMTGPGRIVVASQGNEGNAEEAKAYFNSATNTTATISLKTEDLPISGPIFWKSAAPLTISFSAKSPQGTETINVNTGELTKDVTVIAKPGYTLKCMRLDDAPDGKQVYRTTFVPNDKITIELTSTVTGTQPFELFTAKFDIVSATPASCTLSNAYTVCIPAAYPNVISVGNFRNRQLPKPNSAKQSQRAPEGNSSEIGVMDNSSSYGPTWDGRYKPDVSAPGSIVSAGNWYSPENASEVVESYDIPGSEAKETWVGQFGTSQASPAVAGIIALWLQAKPDLTPDDVLKVIRATSKAIEPIPNNHSGAGIIDAYAGLCNILGLPTAIPTLSKQQPAGITFRLVGQVLYADGAAEGTPVTVYNLSGAVLQQTFVQNGAVRLEGLPAAVYAVQLGTLGSTLIRIS